MRSNFNAAVSGAEGAAPQPIPGILRAPLRIQEGDVVVTLEVAGIWRSGPGLTAPTTQTLSEYRVSVTGQRDGEQVFGLYDPALANADALAATRKVRLFYAEGTALTLLKDYRTNSGH